MTSEMGEMFNELRKERQAKRAKNRDDSVQILHENGVQFIEKNSGAHLIVTGTGGRLFDFWPGTGLWKMRGSNQQHRGVRKLIKVIQTG